MSQTDPRAGSERRRVVIAGASGFIGRSLVTELSEKHDIIALARNPEARQNTQSVEWRSCDLFSLKDAENALRGADVGVYLVHSMLPTARLTQARFEDLDFICADNFARAAASAGVQHIVYLGGLLPSGNEALSRHLESRFEVERTLAFRGAALTTLRAGLIIGAGGSSFEMMAKLVGRLPAMIGPIWTRSLCQPIALDDTVTLLKFAIDRPDLAGRAYDIGGPDVVTYADMLRMTGAALGKLTRVMTLPVRTVNLSLLWVSAITGASQALVRPLVESLSHDMVATDGLALQKQHGLVAQPLKLALESAVRDDAHPQAARKSNRKSDQRRRRSAERRVCSVQRLRVRADTTAEDVAVRYVQWLPRFLWPVLRVATIESRSCSFHIWPLRSPLLVLQFDQNRSTSDRQLFHVTGGLLADNSGGGRPRLEFRTVLNEHFVLAAIHDFVPRLPWFLYKATQALVHLFVMRAFGRHLERRNPV